MVLEKLKSYFNIGNNLYGVEIFHEDVNEIYQLIHIQKIKQELVVVSNKRFDNWENLSEFLDKKIPLCLCINTPEILDKLSSKRSEISNDGLVEQSFPGLDFERFYFNISEFRTATYLAIIEKKSVLTLLEKFKNNNIPILGFSLGLSNLSPLLSYIKNNESIYTNTKHIRFGDDFADILNSTDKANNAIYNINGLKIDSTILLSFGSVLHHLMGDKKTLSNYAGSEIKFKNEYKYLRRFQVLLWPIIGFFLALLLINFFVFNHYYSQLETLNQNVALNISNKEKLMTLRESVNLKESRVAVILGNKNSKSSFFLDQIANSVPNTVLLNELTLQPLLKPLRSEKPIEQDLKTILIKGETSNSDDFSPWITTIENISWIKSVETMEYGFKSKNSSFFTLKLTIDGE